MKLKNLLGKLLLTAVIFSGGYWINPGFAGQETLVIAGIPQMDLPDKKVSKPSWTEVKNALPLLKECAVNAIFIWTPYDAVWPEKGKTIPVQTASGAQYLEIKNSFLVKDYLMPDPSRGTEKEFLEMIQAAHSLGIKVIAQLQITVTAPRTFIYDKHPEWMLKSVYGKPAIFWPWSATQYGYVVDKANPELIKYVSDEVIPIWIKKWGLDGIYLDSAGMAYCDPYIKALCDKAECSQGFECLTPVEGYHSPEPLTRAMRNKIDELAKQTGRDLSFNGELPFLTSRDMPDEVIIKTCKGNMSGCWSDPRVNRTLGKYFDWVQGYSFRSLLKLIDNGSTYSYSENYIRGLKGIDSELEGKYSKTAKFVNMWVEAHKFIDLLKPDVSNVYLTLNITAPGNIVWIGEYQIILKPEVAENYFGYDSAALQNQYKRLITIKKSFPSLQSENIEDALLSPKIPKLIAYNRWVDDESATVVVNASENPVTCKVKTKLEGMAIDLFSNDKFNGDLKAVEVYMPAYSSRILVKENNQNLNVKEEKRNWISEGIIYRTHPIFYPHHSYKEITKQVPVLKNFGVETILLAPIWENFKTQNPNAGPASLSYWPLNYYKLNPAYGTKEDLKELIAIVHKYDMKIMLDLVTAVAPPGSDWYDYGTFRVPLEELKKKYRLEYEEKDGFSAAYCNRHQTTATKVTGEEEYDIIGIIDKNNELVLAAWPNPKIGIATDRKNPKVIEYFENVIEYYLKEFDVDGFRIDAPGECWNKLLFPEDHTIFTMLERLKTKALQVKPNSIFQAESVRKSSYNPRETTERTCEISSEITLIQFFSFFPAQFADSKKFVKSVKRIVDNSYGRLRRWQLENLNTPRVNRQLEIARFSPEALRPFIVMMSTLPGVPKIVAGQEIGETQSGGRWGTGNHEFFTLKPEVDWANGDYSLSDFYKKVFKIRNSHPALKYGGAESISNIWKSGDNIYAYLRKYENESAIITVNLLNREAVSTLDLSFLPRGAVLYDELNNEEFTVNDPDNFRISVSAYGEKILMRKNRPEKL